MDFEYASSDGDPAPGLDLSNYSARPTPKLIALCSPAMGSGKSVVADALVAEHGFVLLKFAGTLKRMIRAFLGAIQIPTDMIDDLVDGRLKETEISGFHALLASRPVATTLSLMLEAMFRDMAIDDATVERMVHGDMRNIPVDGLWVTPRVLTYSLNKWVVDCLVHRPAVTSRWLQQSLGTEWGRDCVRTDLWTTIVRIKVEAYRAMAGGRDIVIDDLRFPNELDLVRAMGGTAVRIVRPGVVVPAKHPSEGQLDEIAMLRIDNDKGLAELRAAAKTLATCPLH